MYKTTSSPAFTSHIADSSYQRLQKALWHKLLIIGLIIFCLLFSLIVWYLNLGILFILAFNCFVFLLYNILGPVLVYWLLWKGGEYVRYCLSFVASHLYISAAVIVVTFGSSLYWKLKSRYEEYKRFGREERMEDDIVFIKAQLQEIKEQQKEIKEQQKEMLNLLKELKSANIHVYR